MINSEANSVTERGKIMSPFLRGRLDEEGVRWLKESERKIGRNTRPGVDRKQTLLRGWFAYLWTQL